MQTIHEENEILVKEGAQVIVAGGGFSGVAAALAAKRSGMEVLLLEKTALLGGLATNGLINWYEPLCDGQGHQLIYGLAEELLRLSIRYGDDTLPRIWQDRSVKFDPAVASPVKHNPENGRYCTYFSPTMCQLAMDEVLLAEGVKLRLDILATKPVMEGRVCRGVICESKSGREFFPADVVIDATGDAELFHRAGCACVEGENFFSVVAQTGDITEKKNALDNREWLAAGADLHGVGHPREKALVAGTTNEEVTEFLLEGRRAILDKIRTNNRKITDVIALPMQPQLRKTRRIVGATTLKEEDCKKYQHDSVGLAADFEVVGDWYEIPFGTLYSTDCDNLLATGRMISS